MFSGTTQCWSVHLVCRGLTSNLPLLTYLVQVDLVTHGETRVMPAEDGTDPFEIPKKKGIFKIVPSGSLLTTHDIVDRIIKNRFV